MLEYRYMESPIGPLLITGEAQTLVQVGFPSGKGKVEVGSDWLRNDTCLAQVVAQLEHYFSGELREFDLELAPRGTDFQRKVWAALAKIPFGETWNYAQLAREVGNPKAARAVGAANGANPIPIIIPCHRVIGADGSLTGFGGGLPTKRWLLAHEGVPIEDKRRPANRAECDPRQQRLFA